jgi:hypothetical protein
MLHIQIQFVLLGGYKSTYIRSNTIHRMLCREVMTLYCTSHTEHKMFGQIKEFCFTILRRFRKIAKSDYYLCHVCLSVCPSVRIGQIGSHWTGFHEIWYFNIFRKSAEEINVLLKSDKNNEWFIWRRLYI